MPKSRKKLTGKKKPVKRSRKPVKRSRKPVKRSRKPVKRSRKPVKRSRKPVKRSRKPVKRSRKPVKRSRKPVKRSRKPRRKPRRKSRRKTLATKSRKKHHKFRSRYKKIGKKDIPRKHRSERIRRITMQQRRALERERDLQRILARRDVKEQLRRKQQQVYDAQSIFGKVLTTGKSLFYGNELDPTEVKKRTRQLLQEQMEKYTRQQRKDRQRQAGPYDKDPVFTAITSDAEGSGVEYSDSESEDEDEDEDEDDLNKPVAEVMAKPGPATKKPITLNSKFYETDIRREIDPRMFIEANPTLVENGFFWLRGLGAGTTGAAGLYDFIPELIQSRRTPRELQRYPPLGSEMRVTRVVVKILDPSESTNKEMIINKHLIQFCQSHRDKNYFGGALICPFLLSRKLPFRGHYTFQWSEDLNVDLWEYTNKYLHTFDGGPDFPFPIVTTIMLQLTSGMIALHNAEVAHCDFKADQCLLAFRNIGDLRLISKVLIADFGHSGLLAKNGKRWVTNARPGVGAFDHQPLSNFYKIKPKNPTNPFYNDIFALGVTFSRLLGSDEIREIAFEYNTTPSLRIIARDMNMPGGQWRSIVEAKEDVLQVGLESVQRRIARCLNHVFGKKTTDPNVFIPTKPIEDVYYQVLRLLLLLGPQKNQLQECLGLLQNLLRSQ